MLVDANLLLFARDETAVQHEAARAWLEDVLNGPTRVGLPWVSLVAFTRVATHPRAYETPLAIHDAWEQVEQWLAAPAAWIPEPTRSHPTILGDLLSRQGLTGNLVSDAHVAAIAIGHGVELCSADSDFARIPQLRWRNPLADS